jgi:tRNA1Val (adenine37-N6)-methyltransferase
MERTLAMHEVVATLDDLLSAAKRILKEGGHFAVIYPSERLSDLICCMRQNSIEPKSIRPIHAKMNTDAKRILVVGKKSAKSGVSLEPPLVIYESEGVYGEEITSMFLP